MVMIFKDTYEDLTEPQLERHHRPVSTQARAPHVKPGPQIDRVFSAPVGGLSKRRAFSRRPATRSQPAPKLPRRSAMTQPSVYRHRTLRVPKTDTPETDPDL
jgi:NADH-quinone oxidoreductase subunit E